MTILDVKGCAQFLKVSPLKIYDMVKKGRLPSVRVGSSIRFIESDLLEYLRGGKANGNQ